VKHHYRISRNKKKGAEAPWSTNVHANDHTLLMQTLATPCPKLAMCWKAPSERSMMRLP
jgi:hypothetical protein